MNDNAYSNDLQSFFEKNEERIIFKWTHYFDIYDKYFKRFRNEKVRFLEIGVYQGGSLQMWKNYFGEKAEIYGVDINPNCKQVEENQIKVFIGDQGNREFWKNFKEEVPRLDIVLDDGSHRFKDQINTFEEMFGHISTNGIYMVEDICTSYLHKYGGGYKKTGSFIEYSKDLVDVMNAWHSHDDALQVSELTRQMYSLNYYNNIVVIEKKNIEEPCTIKTGKLALKIV
jgi:23S rRNA U2552 (ribose-2'-O)-methylase RlmE/FtsJ